MGADQPSGKRGIRGPWWPTLAEMTSAVSAIWAGITKATFAPDGATDTWAQDRIDSANQTKTAKNGWLSKCRSRSTSQIAVKSPTTRKISGNTTYSTRCLRWGKRKIKYGSTILLIFEHRPTMSG